MAYYRGYHHNWYEHTVSQRRQLSGDVGGIDNAVLSYLYQLESQSLCRFVQEYRRRFGDGPAKYAESSFNEWKSGAKLPAAKSVARFLKVVPPLLTYDEKFELLKGVYDRTRDTETHSMTVILGHSEHKLAQLGDLFKRLCQKPSQHTLSPRVQSLLEWASDHDSQIARRLMVALETEQSVSISTAAEGELQRLVRSIREMNQSAEGTHQIDLPYGTIVVTVRHPTFWEKLGKLFS